MRNLNRRRFIFLAGMSTFALAVFRLRPAFALPNLGYPLDLKERAVLSALANIILPGTDRTASATDAGIMEYLDRVVGQKLPRFPFLTKLTEWQPYYKKLVKRLNERANVLADGKDFTALTAEQRETVIAEIAHASPAQVGYKITGMATVAAATDRQLFDMARLHVLQGYFALPEYGGNKDYKGWEAIGYVCNFNYPKDQSHCPPHTM